MSARRRRISGVERAGEVPVALTAAGVSDALWESPDAVAAWCERRGLEPPPALFYGSPRALRDHAAAAWSIKHYPSRFAGIPDWGASARAGVSSIGGARMKLRREAHEKL